MAMAAPLLAAPPVAPPVTALAYRADGQLLAAGTHGVVALIDPVRADLVGTLPGQIGRVSALAFSKTGILAVASGEPGKSGTVRLYDLGKTITSKPIAEIPAHRDAIYTLAFSPDGSMLASAGYDRVIKLWSVARLDRPVYVLQDHSDAVYSIAFHPDGKLLASGSADRAVKIWNIETGQRLYTLSDPTDWVYTVAWSPDGSKLIAGGVDKSIRVWSATAERGTLQGSVFAHSRSVLALVFPPNGTSNGTPNGTTFYSVGEDAVVKQWDAAKLVERKVFAKQPELIHALAFRPDGKQLAIGRFDGVGVFLDPASGANGKTFLPAIPKPPTITNVSPLSAVRGKSARLVIHGQHLDSVSSIPIAGMSTKILQAAPTKLEAELVIPMNLEPGLHSLVLESPAGRASPVTFTVDAYDPVPERGSTDSARTATTIRIPTTIVGTLERAGDTDYFAFEAKTGDEIGVQIVVPNRKINPRLAIVDADGRVLIERDHERIGWKIPRDGRYAVAVRDRDYRGGADWSYRLHIGAIPVVTSIFPLAVAKGRETDVHLSGVHLGSNAPVRVNVPADRQVGARLPLPFGMSVPVAEFPSIVATESGAELRTIPLAVDGILTKPGAAQTIRFTAKRGNPLVVEVHAARLGSPLDSTIEILDAAGNLLPRATLRCIAKTYSVFRDNDSITSGIRIENWNELAMNDYLFVGTELMRIHALPKGPDDDCQFVSRGGQRLGYLGTTPTHHYLGNVMYKVEIHPPGTDFPPNGMPVFPIAWRNDDGGPGFGKDSMLLFDPPADGTYQIRIADARGQGGPAHAYRLTVRPPRPGFTIDANPKMPSLWKGNGIPITVTATRIDGYEGPIRIQLHGLTPGIHAPDTFIEAEQVTTTFTLFAQPDAIPPTAELMLEAKATINEQPVSQKVSLGTPKLVEPGDLMTTVSTDTLTIRPGEETRIRVKVERRNGFTGRVPLDIRGLPHGVRVLNIGLNGILLTERDSEREVVIYAEPWVRPMTHPLCVLSRRESTGKEYAARTVNLTVK